MKITPFLLLLSFTIGSCDSCRKDVYHPSYIPATGLAAGQWIVVSVTHSNSSIPRYVGTSADSVRFTWYTSNTLNFTLDTMYYYLKGSVNKYAVNNFSYGSSATNASIDTLQISPAWAIGYSNNIIVQSYNYDKRVLVFTVNSYNNTDIETDSLYNQ